MNGRALAWIVLAACESGSPGSPIVLENVGRVCLHGDPLRSGPQTFAADTPVNLVYNSSEECLSSSCTTDRSASCTAASQSGVVEVASVVTWRDISAQQGNACTQDCLTLGAQGATAALPAGTYELRFGAGRLALAIPSQHPDPPCIDAR